MAKYTIELKYCSTLGIDVHARTATVKGIDGRRARLLRRLRPRRRILRRRCAMTALGSETNRKLRDMGAGCLVDAIEAQDDGLCMGMTFAERMQMATDEAHSAFTGRKVEQLITRAHLRYPDADVRRLDFAEERKLDRTKIAELATCGYVERGGDVVLQGFTGSGKSYLACALAKEACKRRMR